jgi:hypothetical protein
MIFENLTALAPGSWLLAPAYTPPKGALHSDILSEQTCVDRPRRTVRVSMYTIRTSAVSSPSSIGASAESHPPCLLLHCDWNAPRLKPRCGRHVGRTPRLLSNRRCSGRRRAWWVRNRAIFPPGASARSHRKAIGGQEVTSTRLAPNPRANALYLAPHMPGNCRGPQECRLSRREALSVVRVAAFRAPFRVLPETA